MLRDVRDVKDVRDETGRAPQFDFGLRPEELPRLPGVAGAKVF